MLYRPPAPSYSASTDSDWLDYEDARTDRRERPYSYARTYAGRKREGFGQLPQHCSSRRLHEPTKKEKAKADYSVGLRLNATAVINEILRDRSESFRL